MGPHPARSSPALSHKLRGRGDKRRNRSRDAPDGRGAGPLRACSRRIGDRRPASNWARRGPLPPARPPAPPRPPPPLRGRGGEFDPASAGTVCDSPPALFEARHLSPLQFGGERPGEGGRPAGAVGCRSTSHDPGGFVLPSPRGTSGEGPGEGHRAGASSMHVVELWWIGLGTHREAAVGQTTTHGGSCSLSCAGRVPISLLPASGACRRRRTAIGARRRR